MDPETGLPDPLAEPAGAELAEEVHDSDEEKADGAKRQLTWSSLLEVNRNQFAAVSKRIPIEKLEWDVQATMGQSRTLDMTHVDALKESLKCRPPLAPVRALVWDNGSVFFLRAPHPPACFMSIPCAPHTTGPPLGLLFYGPCVV
jgi:hypothetical protein